MPRKRCISHLPELAPKQPGGKKGQRRPSTRTSRHSKMAPASSLALSARGATIALRRSPAAARKLSSTRALPAKKGASNPPHKPIVLEKPLKFNPPSHGSRLPRKGRTSQHYGGALSKEELKAQDFKDYPTMLAPKGTWAHWFWTSRMVHVYITTGTLLVLGVSTYFMNFAHTSPFKHLLPPISELSEHPIDFIQAYLSVMKLHNQHNSQMAFESRNKKMDDVLKRQAFQMAHKSEKGPMEKYFGLGRKEPDADEPAPEAEADAQAAAKGGAIEEEKPKKKFGLF